MHRADFESDVAFAAACDRELDARHPRRRVKRVIERLRALVAQEAMTDMERAEFDRLAEIYRAGRTRRRGKRQ